MSNRRKSVVPIDHHSLSMQAHATSKTKQPKWAKKLNKFMDSGESQVFLGILLMLSLFFADSWILGNASDSQNEIMYGILMFIVVIFSMEVIILSIVSEGYFNSFFFWMDFLGTISILLDIGWVSDSFLPGGQSIRRGSVLRATRAAKLGARYGRILRLMKLMKFSKWCPCFASNMGEEVEAEPTLSAVVKISNELTGTISRRVALLVVVVVIVVPFLSYQATDYSPDAFMAVLQETARNNTCSNNVVDYYVDRFKTFYYSKDLKLREVTLQSPYHSCGGTYDEDGGSVVGADQVTWKWSFPPERKVTRIDNIVDYWEDFKYNGVNYKVRSQIDYTVPNQWNSFYGIILMILVIIVLFGFSASFHSSIETLVVMPLQKLMSTLRKSATVMIDSLKSLEKEKKVEEKQKRKEEAKKEGTANVAEDDSDEEEDDDIETAVLENLVEKLSKIVKHVLPASNDIVSGNENIDKATANWLNQQYTSGGGESTANNGIVAPADVKLPNQAADGSVLTDSAARKAALEEEEMKLEKQRIAKQSAMTLANIVDPAIINTWSFDVLALKSNEECSEVMTYIFDIVLGFFDEFRVPPKAFRNFLHVLSERYINTNTYHNYRHACDVCHTTYRLMMTAELDKDASGAFSSLEMFSLLVAALGHDVGHPAVNNGFLVKTKHALAFQHNDKSPLENMHCVVLYEIFQQSTDAKETNIFVNLTEAQWREARKVVLACILGTDMVHHFEQVKKTQLFADLNSEGILNYYAGEVPAMECLRDNNNRIFVMELLLHCSDISNPFKPFDICYKWAELVMAEFFAQGDQERALGFDISPGFDRNTTNVFNMQMGFIEFVVSPLISAVINIFPPLHQIGENMLHNFLSWGDKRIQELKNDPNLTPENKTVEVGKLEDRLKKFKDKMNFLETCKANLEDARQAKQQQRSLGGGVMESH